VLHETDARGVREALGEQRVEQGDQAAEDVGEHGQHQLDAEQQQQAVEEPAGQPFAEPVMRVMRRGQPDHLVDDQLAGVERRHGEEGPGQPAGEIGGGLVRQTSFRNGRRLRRAPNLSRSARGGGPSWPARPPDPAPGVARPPME
jgi:hypothetical protein